MAARFMRRVAATGIAVVLAVALLLSAGPVLAKTINCALGVECKGTKRADTITAQGNQQVFAKGGNDTITSVGGASNIYGAGGNDKIIDEFGASIIESGKGNDTIRSKGGKSDLDGGDGDDKITDEYGESQIFGRSGDDTIDAKNGKGDNVDCGSGRDTVTYDQALDDVDNCENKRT